MNGRYVIHASFLWLVAATGCAPSSAGLELTRVTHETSGTRVEATLVNRVPSSIAPKILVDVDGDVQSPSVVSRGNGIYDLTFDSERAASGDGFSIILETSAGRREVSFREPPWGIRLIAKSLTVTAWILTLIYLSHNLLAFLTRRQMRLSSRREAQRKLSASDEGQMRGAHQTGPPTENAIWVRLDPHRNARYVREPIAVRSSVNIGSRELNSPLPFVCIEREGLMAEHARLLLSGAMVTITNLGGGAVKVDGRPLQTGASAELHHECTLTLGVVDFMVNIFPVQVQEAMA